MENAAPRTVLEQLIRTSDKSVPEWCTHYNEIAVELKENATLSERQLRRWMAGGVPYPRSSSQRVAGRVWKLPFRVLVSPPESVDTLEPVASTREILNQESQ
ncbi:hypothetical protein ABZV91_32505 [Nocardia sp. NPDC004568]|uniref:hypothetical protein n=1 Tax=Nocardia sp. NPDC004568 TaxID=3154551 RepID=UPI0033A88D73